MEKIPSILNNDNYIQLELPSLFEKLENLIRSAYGKNPLALVTLERDPDKLRRKLDEVTEMVEIVARDSGIPVSELPDIRPLLNKIKPEDAFLEGSELNQVKINLSCFSDMNVYLNSYREDFPLLWEYGSRIHQHKRIVAEIEKTIDNQGEIQENASPELRRIRKEILHLEGDQKNVLLKVLKRYSEFSQDDIVTLRDGRMVLGIQQQYAGKINGIVHGTSGTGATVFMEPMETLRISNQIQNLKMEERKEIIRIFRFLSGLIREVRNDIFYAIENYGILDFIHARARLSLSMKACAPSISDKPEIRLYQARHPLLILKISHHNVVPSDIVLGESFRTLVITGPNAGGKTVTLKTAGLLQIMAQMGLHIPVNPDSSISLLEDVLVDIGDRQNIEQDLSTFSAHIIRLKQILAEANPNTLVLVDEIGTGTDPREGSALAIAFIKGLTDRRVLTIATTHHGELKAFAYSAEEVENASMEFDLDTLQPVYRLKTGTPGSSYAFEIARRYGLPDDIIKQAEKIVGPDKGQLENLILDLNEKLQQAEKEQREWSIKLSEAEGLRSLYEGERNRLKREKIEQRRKAAEEAKKIVDEANARIEKLVAEIRKSQAGKEQIAQAHREVKEIQQNIDDILEETTPKPEAVGELHQGDVVWIEALREEGEILNEPGEDNKVWVLVDDKRMQLDLFGLRKLEKESMESRRIFRQEAKGQEKLAEGILPELDLRGMDSYEAIEATSRYLDQALNQGWDEVRIIHGKGTGILRQKVNDFLNRDKRVEGKRLGKWGEGDTGVTVVKLKKESGE
jgi:DNA mismatch repair protein MutS2